MVVVLSPEDNADRISVFKLTRLMLPGFALRSPIVSMFPSKPAIVRKATTCAMGVFTKFDAFHSLKVTRPSFTTGRNECSLIFWPMESATQTALDVSLTCKCC